MALRNGNGELSGAPLGQAEGAEETDIAVIGGGPAGAAFARLVSSRCRVTLLDARPSLAPAGIRKAGGRKCCGGLLAPDAQTELAAQGLTLPLDVLVDPQIFAVRVVDLALPRGERLYPRSYINMDRDRFDRWLLSLVPEGRVRLGCRVTAVTQMPDGRYRLDYRWDGQRHTLLARCLVGADGGDSLVRRTFFAGHPLRRYAAVQEWYAAEEQPPVYGALFDREVTDCTGWLIAKNGAVILGAALPLDRAAARFEQLKIRLAHSGYAFGPRLRREGCVVCRPSRLSQLCLGAQGVFLLGEAAGWISPSSLEGISWALKSGAALARCFSGPVDPAAAQRQYRRETAGLRMKLRQKLWKCPFLYTPALRQAILRSRIASLPQPSPQPSPSSRPSSLCSSFPAAEDAGGR